MPAAALLLERLGQDTALADLLVSYEGVLASYAVATRACRAKAEALQAAESDLREYEASIIQGDARGEAVVVRWRELSTRHAEAKSTFDADSFAQEESEKLGLALRAVHDHLDAHYLHIKGGNFDVG